MFQNKYTLSQLISSLDRSKFNLIVDKLIGDKYVKHSYPSQLSSDNLSPLYKKSKLH